MQNLRNHYFLQGNPFYQEYSGKENRSWEKGTEAVSHFSQARSPTTTPTCYQGLVGEPAVYFIIAEGCLCELLLRKADFCQGQKRTARQLQLPSLLHPKQVFFLFSILVLFLARAIPWSQQATPIWFFLCCVVTFFYILYNCFLHLIHRDHTIYTCPEPRQ